MLYLLKVRFGRWSEWRILARLHLNSSHGLQRIRTDIFTVSPKAWTSSQIYVILNLLRTQTHSLTWWHRNLNISHAILGLSASLCPRGFILRSSYGPDNTSPLLYITRKSTNTDFVKENADRTKLYQKLNIGDNENWRLFLETFFIGWVFNEAKTKPKVTFEWFCFIFIRFRVCISARSSAILSEVVRGCSQDPLSEYRDLILNCTTTASFPIFFKTLYPLTPLGGEGASRHLPPLHNLRKIVYN